jgi:hypothetical protein
MCGFDSTVHSFDGLCGFDGLVVLLSVALTMALLCVALVALLCVALMVLTALLSVALMAAACGNSI